MTTAAATSGAQPEKAKELEEAKKHGAGVAERDGVQPTATWLQVHMQFMFLSLFFFSGHPPVRSSISSVPFRSWEISFCGGKTSGADHVPPHGFSPGQRHRLSC